MFVCKTRAPLKIGQRTVVSEQLETDIINIHMQIDIRVFYLIFILIFFAYASRSYSISSCLYCE